MRPDLRLAPGLDLQDWLILEARPSSEACHCWKAQNLLTDDMAEMRIYNPDLVPSAMVVREMNLLAELCHPGFPRMVGQFPYRGTHVVLTSYIEGCSLALLMEPRRALPPEMAENAGCELLAAMNHLHGLPGTPVHRALHPGNVMVDEAMNVVVCGLAFVEPLNGLAESETLYYSMGDARYEAPEVLANPAATSAAANVYSCGAILFELFTGRRAFDSEETVPDRWYQEIAYLQQSLPAPLISDYAPGVPQRISDTVNLALSKDPADRPLSCLAAAYLLRGSAPPPPPSPEYEPVVQEVAAGKRSFWNWFGQNAR